ncbi:MAG: hypothetical protein KBF17_08975 [Candidatus Promineofilum sp.]|nr:hypothetical protein [Promineifilum sp.]
MRIGGIYSFNGGEETITTHYRVELDEVYSVIGSINAENYRTKTSREKTSPGRILFSPRQLNRAYREAFSERDWYNHRVLCEYPTSYYTSGYTPGESVRGAFREMDFVKNRVGVEIQFGKYAFMVYNVCAKMTIFHNEGVIDVGIEVVPLKELAREMSSGISYFEQFVWDLNHRGVADIDIPVLILGVTV